MDNKTNTTKKQTNIVYKGIVTISQESVNKPIKRKSYKRYNSGDVGLFEFICRALRGDNNLNIFRPCYLKGLNGTGLVFNNLIELRSCDVNFNDLGGIKKYIFFIPYSYITENTLTKVQLLASNNNPCAEVDLSNQPVSIDKSSNLIIQ